MGPEEQREVRRFLTAGEWFGGLPAALQDLILSRSVARKYAKGQVISLEDSAAKGLFAVLEGEAHVVREVGSGDEALLHVCEPGFWFGEYPMLTGKSTVATHIARTPVRMLVLSKVQFDRILAEEPRYFEAFARLPIERYGLLLRMIAELGELAPEARLRGRLAMMVQQRKRDGEDTGATSLALSQADLARMLGVSRQTLNALLAKLQQAGLIEVGFRRIRVLDPARLADPNAPREVAAEGPGDGRRRAVRPSSLPRGERAG